MERLAIIEALKHAPDELATAVAGLTEENLRYRPSEGEWSVKEVVGHARDMAAVWQRRLYMIWSLTDPLFPAFDGGNSVIDNAYQDADPLTLIEAMRVERLKTVDLLSHAVDWTRTGMQRGVGRRTLMQFAAFVIEHDREHLEQVRSLKEAQGLTGA